MNGDIGFTEIKPDQMQLINPLLILVFIPLFDCAVYPILSKFGLRRPLQKLATGGILAGIAFMISGFVELELEKTYPIFPSPNESQIRIFNGVPCSFELQNFPGSAAQNQLAPLNAFKFSLAVNDTNTKYVVFSTASRDCTTLSKDLKVTAGSANSFFITGNPSAPEIQSFDDKVEKSKSGNPFVRVLSNVNDVKEIRFLNVESSAVFKTISPQSMEQFEILPSSYFVFADDIKISKVDVHLGGVYTIIISHASNGSLELQNHEITTPNTIHMLWLIPQYVVMTAAEVMFSVTGLEFAYSQAPASMKSLLQASWLLTVAFGNVIVVIIAEAKFFQSQAHEFFLFAVMMFIDMALFGLLAMRYKYVNIDKGDDVENAIQIEDSSRKTFTNNAFQDE
jgi:solute carrier family 15 oligopeptide transporter 1